MTRMNKRSTLLILKLMVSDGIRVNKRLGLSYLIDALDNLEIRSGSHAVCVGNPLESGFDVIHRHADQKDQELVSAPF